MISTQLSQLKDFSVKSDSINKHLQELAVHSEMVAKTASDSDKALTCATELQAELLSLFNDLSLSFSQIKKIKSEISSSKPKTTKIVQ